MLEAGSSPAHSAPFALRDASLGVGARTLIAVCFLDSSVESTLTQAGPDLASLSPTHSVRFGSVRFGVPPPRLAQFGRRSSSVVL